MGALFLPENGGILALAGEAFWAVDRPAAIGQLERRAGAEGLP